MKVNNPPKRRGPPRNAETDAIAHKLGVTKRQADKLVKKGVTADNVDSLAAAKLAKLKTEVEVLLEKLAILRREHVPASKVREDALSAFAIVRAEISSQEVRLPPLLEGLNAKEMRTVLAGHGERLLKDLSERLEAIA